MEKRLVINVNEHETRVALLEDGTIAELMIERRDESTIAGNVYKGKVVRVLPGMQAAFVDIGLHHAAFLHASDLYYKHTIELNGIFNDGGSLEDELPLNGDGFEYDLKANEIQHIEEYLTEGQEILVQVAKSPLGRQGGSGDHAHLAARALSGSHAHIKSNWSLQTNTKMRKSVQG